MSDVGKTSVTSSKSRHYYDKAAIESHFQMILLFRPVVIKFCNPSQLLGAFPSELALAKLK